MVIFFPFIRSVFTFYIVFRLHPIRPVIFTALSKFFSNRNSKANLSFFDG